MLNPEPSTLNRKTLNPKPCFGVEDREGTQKVLGLGFRV